MVLTLPDKVGDPEETARLTREFAKACRGHGATIGEMQHMMVVQHYPDASLFEWMDVYIQLSARNVCDWIALPRILAGRRIELIRGLHKLGAWSPKHKHHAFGMNAGELNELVLLNTLGVASCDSSAPVWRGLHGYKIEDETWPDIPFDPHYKMEEDITIEPNARMSYLQLADRNLAEVQNRCLQRSEMPSIIRAEHI